MTALLLFIQAAGDFGELFFNLKQQFFEPVGMNGFRPLDLEFSFNRSFGSGQRHPVFIEQFFQAGNNVQIPFPEDLFSSACVTGVQKIQLTFPDLYRFLGNLGQAADFSK